MMYRNQTQANDRGFASVALPRTALCAERLVQCSRLSEADIQLPAQFEPPLRVAF